MTSSRSITEGDLHRLVDHPRDSVRRSDLCGAVVCQRILMIIPRSRHVLRSSGTNARLSALPPHQSGRTDSAAAQFASFDGGDDVDRRQCRGARKRRPRYCWASAARAAGFRGAPLEPAETKRLTESWLLRRRQLVHSTCTGLIARTRWNSVQRKRLNSSVGSHLASVERCWCRT
jgi:hypothetical protein